MKNLLLLLGGILCICPQLIAQPQTGVITGRIIHLDEPLIGVNVGIEQIQKGSSTNAEGHYRIQGIPAGVYKLQASAVGYKTKFLDITIKPGATLNLDIHLEPSLLELEYIVVTGTMRETYVKDSPVKVHVVSQELLRKNPSGNLMEGISYINGLYQQVNCGVCGTNDIRINGMDGPYTSVLIDGMPVMGSLASVYGLNGINPAIIQSVEIIKGPNSTLYGSEAMGGVINVRTTDPGKAPRLTMEAYGTTHEEINADLSYSPRTRRHHTVFSGNVFYFDRFLDHNGDGFADITKRKRVALFNRWSFDRADNRAFNLAWKYYSEDRMGGVERYGKAHRGSDTIYGEAVETNRFELLGSYQLPVQGEHLRADFSYSYHDQNSYYGDYRYSADQEIFFTNLVWDKQFSATRQLLAGGTFRYDKLNQTFDEQRLEDGSEDYRFIPGLFAQYEHIFNPSWRGLVGFRTDHYDEHGFIFSPRFNLKIRASNHTTIRLNAGTGFRIVNLFTEQHDVLSGSRRVVISEHLDPERSFNATLNLNQIIDIGISVLNIDLDLFHTYFTNQIIPDYSISNEIRYSNLEGHAVSRGVSLSAAHNFPGPLMYSLGVTLQDVYREEARVRAPLLYAPDWSGVFSLSYALESLQISIDWTGRIVGKMHLPEYPGYSAISEVYTEQNIKISRPLSREFEVYASVKNLFNYTQQDPLVAPAQPFSDEFATDRVYGPLQGRRLMAGIRYMVK